MDAVIRRNQLHQLAPVRVEVVRKATTSVSLRNRPPAEGDVPSHIPHSAAKRAIENLRAEINAAQDHLGELTVCDLWGHFQANELHNPNVDRSFSTIALYLDNFKRYILPFWGTKYLHAVKAVAVEQWLSTLPYAPSTKSKLRNQLSAMFNHAIRHELWEKANPIATVRQSAKRLATPDTLSLKEIRAILDNLERPMHQTAVLIAAVTGLRRSEIRGLKWEDIDVVKLWITLRRGKFKKVQTKLKTDASRKGVPIPRELAEVLLAWRGASLYRADEDWVFASEVRNGAEPVWLDIVLQNYVQPAAVAAKITKQVGWHTFRRSLATLLATKGENVKVVQELLRHANSSVTLQLYQQGDEDQKRAAQGHTSDLFLVRRAS